MRSTESFPETLVELLQLRAHQQPDRGFTFLSEGEAEAGRFSFRALDARARALGAWLDERTPPGARVLLLLPQGLDFIAALFGCLYAKRIPVAFPAPTNRAKHERSSQRLAAVVSDAGATLALTTSKILAMVKEAAPSAPAALTAIRWESVEDVPSEPTPGWEPKPVAPGELAFLQYTSGSTAIPKGVMLSHRNVMHNLRCIQERFAYDSNSLSVVWVPHFHDLGLMEGILQPVFSGCDCYQMSPAAFIQRPIRWLSAISRYRATHSSGPNFAYELCLRKVTPEQAQSLDLSSWKTALNAAEPIRWSTLRKFHEMFGPHGFRWETFFPGYGLAETSLMVSAGHVPKRALLDRAALERGEVEDTEEEERGTSVLSCGRLALDTEVAIVDPETLEQRPPGRIGEIWVASPSVAQGYWNRAEESQRTFRARIAGSGRGPFLRTGDLGFVRDGEVYVAGRVKDMIIIRGRNLYPQDLEALAEAGHPEIRPSFCAAFGVEVEGEEQLVLVAALNRPKLSADPQAIIGAIRDAIAGADDVYPYAVVLIEPSGLPKTSSGKVQRRACREAFLHGALPVIAADGGPPPLAASPAADPVRRTERGLIDKLAGMLRKSASVLGAEVSLGALGLDSIMKAELAAWAQSEFGVELQAAALAQSLTIGELARALQGAAALPAVPCPTPSAPRPSAPARAPSVRQHPRAPGGVDFSLFYFSNNELADQRENYALVLDSARIADRKGFRALWLPERHFHPFGCICTNPSVLGAALAGMTRQIRIRAGSVILPLHHPLRVAEDWSVVDNLSEGRVDLAFATGWNPNDFVLAPDKFSRRREEMYAGIETIQAAWRGDPIACTNGSGNPVEVRLFPRPVQPSLSTWVTCTGGVEGFVQAGALGYNVLTALLFQSPEELATKIALYRSARAQHGFDPDAGEVTLMVHTYVGAALEEVRRTVRAPFLRYLESSVDLWRHGWKDLGALSPEERERVLENAFERYFQQCALFGTPDTCQEKVEQFRGSGVTEIACLIDFGVEMPKVLQSLEHLDRLRQTFQRPMPWDGAESLRTDALRPL